MKDVLNVIIDAIENDRVVDDKISENGYQRKIYVQAKCGMIIEITYDLNTKSLNAYPQIAWILKNKDFCNGYCRYKHEA